MDYIIGVDFDNTLVSYDIVMYHLAVRWGLISPDIDKSKRAVRDKIRSLPGGEIEWQRLQSVVYGSSMNEAKLMDGVPCFFELCHKHGVETYIISHKTRFANSGDTKTDLQSAAMEWMKKNRFFAADGLCQSPEAVYFESSRASKIRRICSVGCTHFIDDLEETFLEDSFPTNVEKILYAPHKRCPSLDGVRAFANWQEVTDYFFAARH